MLTMETDDSGIVLIKASGRLSKPTTTGSCRNSSASPERGPVRMLIELEDFHG